MQGLVSHLHQFAREVELSEPEWQTLIAALTSTGQITDDRRQEFILWSDTLGLSMLVDSLANPLPAGATESTVLGPFYVPDAPLREYGESMVTPAGGPAGPPAWVHGRVLDVEGPPIAGAELDVWQNGPDRLYAVQRPEAPEDHLRGRYLSREDGSYALVAVRPVPYTIPDDGPVGRMLTACGRHPWRPAHIHMIVRARISNADHPYLRRRQRLSSVRRCLRRQALADPDLRGPGGRRPRSPTRDSRGLGLGRQRPRARTDPVTRHGPARPARREPLPLRPRSRGRQRSVDR
jgi:protocatechuate 3,4-dioxygenase beta subunit